MSVLDAIEHLLWTFENSPKAYELHRESIRDLVEKLQLAEFDYRERKEKENAGHTNNATESGCENQTMASGHGGYSNAT